MNNYKKILKYRLQLLFVAFVVLGFASYIIWNAVNDKNKAIAFSQLEIYGVKTLPSLKNLLVNTEKLRGITVVYKAGNTSLRSQIQEQTAVVTTALQATKQALAEANLKGISPLFSSINSKLQNTMSAALSQTEKESFENYSDVIDNEFALIVKVGDMSNLILDSDLDTFYLIDAVINKLPSLVKATGGLRGLGGAVLAAKMKNNDTDTKLAILFGSLKDAIAATKSSFNSAYSYNGQVKATMDPAFEKLCTSVNRLRDELKKITQGDFSTSSTDYFQTASDVINNTVSLYGLSNKSLLRLLNIRVDKLKTTRDEVIAESIVFLLILIVLFYIAYDYLYKNLLVREAAKKEQTILEELKKANNSLIQSLTHDNLTGMHNRSSLVKEITDLKNSAIIMLIDIRAFKEINDAYGGDFGNRVLVKFTKYLNQFFTNITQTTLYTVNFGKIKEQHLLL